MKKRIFTGILIVLLLSGMAVSVFSDYALKHADNSEKSEAETEKNEAETKETELTIERKNTELTIGEDILPENAEGSIVYDNTQYGFRFVLPESWANFTVVTEHWEGMSVGEPAGDRVVETGPMLNIRHPLWTEQEPRQDIPIMIFTAEQWESLNKGEFHIGAAPVGPSEIEHNSRYVFALPARYNYAFPTGFEEVEKILDNNPLKPFEKLADISGLGGISLGDSPERVIEVLGSNYTESVEPDTAGFIGEDMTVWSYENDTVVYIGQTSGKVLKVTTASPDLKTSLSIKVGDNAETVFKAYRLLYEEAVSRHRDEVLEGWFLMEDGIVMIFDFDKSDGVMVNSDVTSDFAVEEIILAYWKHFD